MLLGLADTLIVLTQQLYLHYSQLLQAAHTCYIEIIATIYGHHNIWLVSKLALISYPAGRVSSVCETSLFQGTKRLCPN